MHLTQRADRVELQANEVEREIFERELDSFVPDRGLDAHAHMWAAWAPDPKTGSDPEPHLREDMTLEQFRLLMDELVPGRTVGGLMLAWPFGGHGLPRATADGVLRQAEHIAREVGSDPLCRATMFVSPSMDPDFVMQEARRLNVAGLKCYHTESPRTPTGDSEIPEFLPEGMVRVADELGLCVTLHMVKDRSVADPVNQHWIRTYCEKYPNMKLILAHAARSFNPVWAMEGIASLKGLPNLYCDTAAIGEVGACEAIIENLGHDRLVWGTDFPISHWRGNYVAFGNGHTWVGPESHTRAEPETFVFHGIEQLRVLKQAAWHTGLSDSQVEDIFFNNLAGLIGVKP